MNVSRKLNSMTVLFLAAATSIFLVGCARTTRNIAAVKPFDLQRYMGTWHEIARLPNSFEKGLTRITADYTLRPDGKVSVVNRGWNGRRTKEARGTAYVSSKNGSGELRVTFFWPFYGSYRIIELDPDYQYAIVTSDTMNYLWILSKSPEMNQPLLDRLIAKARELGFDTSKLIISPHSGEKLL